MRGEVECENCHGKGFHNWAADEMCQVCHGTGRVPYPPIPKPSGGAK